MRFNQEAHIQHEKEKRNLNRVFTYYLLLPILLIASLIIGRLDTTEKTHILDLANQTINESYKNTLHNIPLAASIYRARGYASASSVRQGDSINFHVSK